MSQAKTNVRGWLLIISLAVIASLTWDLFTAEPDGISVSSSSDQSNSNDNTDEQLLKLNEADSDQVSDQPNSEGVVSTEASDDQENDDELKLGKERFPVYIVGAVNKPGIYKIAHDTCLYELIEQAGGLTETAAGDRINLAARLSMHQLIRIPTKEEWLSEPDKYNYIDSGAENSQHDNTTKLININSADADQLEELPGVGPSTAKAIIDHRDKNGPFKTIEELMLVSGIKENRFASLRDYITV